MRRLAGIVITVVVASVACLFVLGTWNPWRLVVLDRYFHDPLLGLVLVSAGSYLALWSLAPVRDETVRRWRIPARVTVAVTGLVGLLLWGILGSVFDLETTELARSRAGDRAVAAVTGADGDTHLRVWTGSGLATRAVGDIGRVCGSVSVRFLDADLVELDTSYGTWQVALDPDSGEPLSELGPRCSDGPLPATLGP